MIIDILFVSILLTILFFCADLITYIFFLQPRRNPSTAPGVLDIWLPLIWNKTMPFIFDDTDFTQSLWLFINIRYAFGICMLFGFGQTGSASLAWTQWREIWFSPVSHWSHICSNWWQSFGSPEQIVVWFLHNKTLLLPL